MHQHSCSLNVGALIAASFQLTTNDPGLDAGLILVRIQEVMERIIVVKQLVGLDVPMKRPWQDVFFLVPYNDTKSYHKNSVDTFLGVGDEVFAMRWNSEEGTYCPIYHKAEIKQLPSRTDGRVMLLYRGDKAPKWVESVTRIDPFGITPVIVRRVCIKKTQEYYRVVKPLKKKRKLDQLKEKRVEDTNQLSVEAAMTVIPRINPGSNPSLHFVNPPRATTKMLDAGPPVKKRMLLSPRVQRGRGRRRSSSSCSSAKSTKRQRTTSPSIPSWSTSKQRSCQEKKSPQPTFPVDKNGFRYLIDPSYKISWPVLDVSLHVGPLVEPIVEEQIPPTHVLEKKGYMSALGLYHRWDQMKQIQSKFTADSFL